MFTLYTLLLTLHILFVTAWLGSAMTVQVITRMSGDDPAWPPVFNKFAEKWFPPITGIAGVLGILLWIDGPWDFGEPWILIAAVGWIISSVVGATQLSPRVKRWSEGDASARAEFQTFAQVDLLLLVLIVADMVMKPGS
jgi:uncharacterized membrane protein